MLISNRCLMASYIILGGELVSNGGEKHMLDGELQYAEWQASMLFCRVLYA